MMPEYEQLGRRAEAVGLALRGAFHPARGEMMGANGLGTAGTVALLGFTGSLQWQIFKAAREAADGQADPLDRWSRRIIDALAAEFGAAAVYPSGKTPTLPFQRLALDSEPVHPSPLGLLIHPHFGLWHAYRGALLFADRIEFPTRPESRSPCTACTDKPCLSGCPVGAFKKGALDVKACTSHVESLAGIDCRDRGCRARRACPIGREFAYAEEQARFHLDAFVRSVARAPTLRA
jgi:hypothetical protein